MERITWSLGPTDWAPGTCKFLILDWKDGKRPIGIAIGPDAASVRKSPPTLDGFGALNILLWQKNGAPLRKVAVVVVTNRGWKWVRYDGKVSWAKKDYRNENFR